MHSIHSGVITRSRALRNLRGPKTPEPGAESETPAPPAPRPRFKLKRRNAPHLQAPTEHFLASVAAADIPIPSIEEPRVVDEEMIDTYYPVIHSLQDINSIDFSEESFRGRTLSPPKTPAPGMAPSLSPKRYPDWSISGSVSDAESGSDCESSRPSTARSTQTSASLFSRYSIDSDDLSECISPETEQKDFLGASPLVGKTDKTLRPIHQTVRSRRAPWTKQMSQHLWSTYMTYLQDPKVTPFRANKSGIPPSGVCFRVAREAKKSWKGSKPRQITATKSGSTTPTGENQSAFIQWPHTCAATRGHLRELCRINASSTGMSRQFFAHSPTPFGRTATATRFLNRRSNNSRTPSVFSASDMAMSLAVSTAPSMQPNGPLAQLTRSQDSRPVESSSSGLLEPLATNALPHTPPPGRTRLGSPFMAKSYGPSSSSVLSELGPSSYLQSSRQNQTLGPRRSLRSPLRSSHYQLSTNKRPSEPVAAEPRKSKRPSLVSDLWTQPAISNDANAFGQDTSALPAINYNAQSEEMSRPRANLQELFEAPKHRAPQASLAANIFGRGVEPYARLGSPFAANNASRSFPHRVLSSSSMALDAMRRPFATIQQPTETHPRTPTRPSLATRLAYIDERLRDFRHRDHIRRRSQSPSQM